ncbi:hypothetical protein [Xanthomonas campestris]|uniref:hypothetical protein n=1 Tax=Xanthomonas campestris TaxID=339 RepID=UPI002B23947E|nr:hypothetical protein [Xanthomonas campestris]MEA9657825.1 hypothetical protein [Xanthomonas campestris pv. raphani]
MHTTTPILRFTALRRYDVRTGIGDVVAVFFVAEQTGAEREKARHSQANRSTVAYKPRNG